MDIAVAGIPFDTATSYRPGARFGPEAIRAGSMLLRPWHPSAQIDVFANQSVVDYGDLDVTPGNATRTLEQIDRGLSELIEGGVIPIVLGGDHTILLGELRAYARQHGPLALVLLDAHADTWDDYYGERYFHGTVLRRAVEEGLIDTQRSVLAGMRGPLYSADDLELPRELGFEVIVGEELRRLSPHEYGQIVSERAGSGAAFISFDIDVIDPAFAPGTGTPEVAGLLPHEALPLVRALAGVNLVGFDIVEVAPAYDNAASTTAMLAANVVHEFLALVARSKLGRLSPGRNETKQSPEV